MLKVENVSKTYGKRKILNNISFTVPEGEIYTLVGALGEGKTTLLDIITGFERPDSGEITIKGTDCLLSIEKARKLFGYVPEVFPSYPNMTAKEYMKFFGRMIDDSEDDDKIKHLTVNLLGFVGLSDVMDKRIRSFNRVQKNKLSIARALLHNPRFIILDEPFLGLDASGVREIKEILDFLHGQGRTVFMTSDNLNLSASLSTSVGIIENGSMLYGDQTHQAYENIHTNSIQLRNTSELDVREVKRQLNNREMAPLEMNQMQMEMAHREMTKQPIEEPVYEGLEQHSLTNLEDFELEHTGPLPIMKDMEMSGNLDYTAQLPNLDYDRSVTGYDESELHYTSSRGYDGSELDYTSSRGYDGSELDYTSSRGYDESELDYTSSRGYDESELDYISGRGYDESELEYNMSSHVYDEANHDYGRTVRVYDEVEEMPYEQVQAIERTKKNDIDDRIMQDLELDVYDHDNISRSKNDDYKTESFNSKNVVSKRGIIEKRGAGGSRVVTNKSNYKPKNKKK